MAKKRVRFSDKVMSSDSDYELSEKSYHPRQKYHLLKTMHSSTNKNLIKPINRSINNTIKFLQGNSKAGFIIAALSLILGGVTLLLLSILMPQTISIAFTPSLNIVQTKIISGFAILAGLLMGANHLLCKTNEDDNQISNTKNYSCCA